MLLESLFFAAEIQLIGPKRVGFFVFPVLVDPGAPHMACLQARRKLPLCADAGKAPIWSPLLTHSPFSHTEVPIPPGRPQRLPAP